MTQEFLLNDNVASLFRPKRLTNVIGQKVAVGMIKGMFKRRSIKRQLLLTGASGVGKTSVARIIAAGINCLNFDTKELEPCGKCESCKAIYKDKSLDLVEMDFGSDRGIDVMRELRDRSKYRANGKFRVFVLDEVHKATKDAFDALLKPLEEPKGDTIWILATTAPESIPETIITRCSIIPFSYVAEKDIRIAIKRVCKKLKFNLPKVIYKDIAEASYGSLRNAVKIVEQVIDYAQGIDVDLTSKTGIEQLRDVFCNNIASEARLTADNIVQALLYGKLDKAVIVSSNIKVQQAWSILSEISNTLRLLAIKAVAPKQTNRLVDLTWKRVINGGKLVISKSTLIKMAIDSLDVSRKASVASVANDLNWLLLHLINQVIQDMDEA